MLTIIKHPLIDVKLSIMRDENTPTKEFRESINEIASFMCFEVFKDLKTHKSKETYNTPTGYTLHRVKLDDKIIIVPILRAGIGLCDGIKNMIPTARIGHIGMYRNEETLEPVEYYYKMPKEIKKRTVMILDPMLATGGSALATIKKLKADGVKRIKFLCIIAAPEGLKAIQKEYPDVEIYCASVDRKLNDISSHTVLKHSILPSSMNWDEFKATKDTKGKMAFLIVDNNKGNIFDILDSRKSRDLEKYFRRYPRYVRDKVRFISIDFYSGYIFLAKKLFKKAKVVIDPFHIVTQCYVALNSTRISLCKKNNIHYNKLKDLWKLIIKNENDLSNKKVYSKHFHKKISQIDMVNYMINTNQTLRADYNCYQGIINSLKEKNFIKFKKIIEHPSKDLSIKMKNALKLYRENIKYIENTFNYNINNGIIEGTNNIIKTIKRIAFGYKRFDHFVSRIFLIKGIIKG